METHGRPLVRAVEQRTCNAESRSPNESKTGSRGRPGSARAAAQLCQEQMLIKAFGKLLLTTGPQQRLALACVEWGRLRRLCWLLVASTRMHLCARTVSWLHVNASLPGQQSLRQASATSRGQLDCMNMSRCVRAHVHSATARCIARRLSAALPHRLPACQPAAATTAAHTVHTQHTRLHKNVPRACARAPSHQPNVLLVYKPSHGRPHPPLSTNARSHRSPQTELAARIHPRHTTAPTQLHGALHTQLHSHTADTTAARRVRTHTQQPRPANNSLALQSQPGAHSAAAASRPRSREEG